MLPVPQATTIRFAVWTFTMKLLAASRQSYLLGQKSTASNVTPFGQASKDCAPLTLPPHSKPRPKMIRILRILLVDAYPQIAYI